MTAARHASDARDEIQRLRFSLQAMCECSLLGIAPTSAELHAAFLGAGAAEYHACRTMVAIDCGARRGSDFDAAGAVAAGRRCDFSSSDAR